jgi:hypothetical protein
MKWNFRQLKLNDLRLKGGAYQFLNAEISQSQLRAQWRARLAELTVIVEVFRNCSWLAAYRG